jgi:hypothetical protein
MKSINALYLPLLLSCLLTVSTALAQSGLGTAFTYQGQLQQNGQPADGTFDLTFELFADDAGTSALGAVCIDDITITDGLFAVELDFGFGVFADGDRWLEISTRVDTGEACDVNSGAYTTLSPLQKITPAPQAQYAVEAGGIVGSLNVDSIQVPPGEPMVVGRGNFVDGPDKVFVSGNYAYIGDTGLASFIIADISDPTNPQFVSSLQKNTLQFRSIDVAGRYAYLTMVSPDRFLIVDVIDPTNPQIVKSINVGSADALTLTGNYAYVADNISSEIKIVDISQPATAAVVGALGPINNVRGLFFHQGLLYIAEASSSLLRIANVSDPDNPLFIGSVDTGILLNDIEVSGNYAYILAGNSGDFAVVDVSNPTNPTLRGMINFSEDVEAISVAGRYAYVTTSVDAPGGGFELIGELHIIDTIDPDNPTIIASSVIGDLPADIFIAGQYAYVGDLDLAELIVLKIGENEINSLTVNSLDIAKAQVQNDLTIQGQLSVEGGINAGVGGLYTWSNVGVGGDVNSSGTVTASKFVGDGSMITNVPNADPDPTNEYNTNLQLSGMNLELTDGGGTLTTDLSPLADSLFGDTHSLDAVDGSPVDAVFVQSEGLVGIGTTSPSAGLEIQAQGLGLPFNAAEIFAGIDDSQGGSFSTLENPSGIFVEGDTLYVLSRDDMALNIFDISDPTSPALLGTAIDTENGGAFSALESAWSVHVADNIAYVASSVDDGFSLIDVSDPTNPIELGVAVDNSEGGLFTRLGGCRAAIPQNNYVYTISASEDAFSVFDVSDPGNILEVAVARDNTGGFTGLDSPLGMTISGNYAYVASNNDASLTIIDISNPLAPVEVGVARDQSLGGDFTALLGAQDVQVINNIAYVVSILGDSLTIIDVSDPANPAELGVAIDDEAGGTFSSLQGAFRLDVEGEIVYVSALLDNAITVIDVSDPTTPIELGSVFDDTAGGSISSIEEPFDIWGIGDIVIATSTADAAVSIIDIDIPISNLGLRVADNALVEGRLTAARFSGDGSLLTGINVNDADADSSNELNETLVLNGTTLELTDNGGTLSTDLASLQDGTTDADADPTNELNNSFSLNGNTLELTDAGGTLQADLASLTLSQIQSASGNTIASVSDPGNFIAGDSTNSIDGTTSYSSISGGMGNSVSVFSFNSIIGGGQNNTLTAGATSSVIGGGDNNLVRFSATTSVIGGGQDNIIEDVTGGTIGGGVSNLVNNGASHGTIAGGTNNLLSVGAESSTVGGGNTNHVTGGASQSTIGGGFNNTIDQGGLQSTIAGGTNNLITNSASQATIGGGSGNKIDLDAIGGTIPGGLNNTVGRAGSFAAGRLAQAAFEGNFVWNSDELTTFTSSGDDQFLVNAPGGVGIGTSTPVTLLDVAGAVTATAFIGDGSGLTGITDNINDADADPTNEYNTNLQLSGMDLQLTDGGGTLTADLSPLAGSVFGDSHSLDSMDGSLIDVVKVENDGNVLISDSLLVEEKLSFPDPTAVETLDQEVLPGILAFVLGQQSQTFTAGITGQLTRLDLSISSSTGATTNFNLEIIEVDSGTVLYSETQSTDETDLAVAGVSVTAGSQYEISVNPAGTIFWNRINSGDYPGGEASGGGPDLAFTTYVTPPGGLAIDGTSIAFANGASFNPNTIVFSDGTTQTTAFDGLVDDADADPTNELNTNLQLNGMNLELSDAGGMLTADLSPLAGSVFGDGHSLDAEDGSTTDVLFVSSLGNVGIGTKTPAEALTVDGGNILQTPGNPVQVGSLGIGGLPQAIYVSGSYAYVVDSTSEDLRVINISDPTSPTLTGSVGLGELPRSVFVSGRYAYVVDEDANDLKVIDVSNPSSPVITGTLGIGTAARSVYVSGHYAYVADPISDDLRVIDVSNPSIPALAGLLDLGGSSSPQSVYVSGRYAYLADTGDNALKVIDISDPSSPVLTGSLGIGELPNSLNVSGRYAYVVDLISDDFRVIDISDPTNPVQTALLNVGTSLRSVDVSGRYAYVVDSDSDDLKIIDISDPFAPTVIDSVGLGSFPSLVSVSGRYAYVLDAGIDELSVIDISGGEVTSLIAHSLEAGNLQVRNDIIAQGQLQVTSGITAGTGGIYSAGNIATSGTVKAEKFIGDGSMLTGVTGTSAQTLSGSGSEVTLSDGGGTLNVSALAASDGNPNIALSVDADGNVGIGTNSPGAALHVTSDFNIGEAIISPSTTPFSGGGSALLRLFDAANLQDGVRFLYQDGGLFSINMTQGGTDASRSLVIEQGTGDVGIGLASQTPSANLHVADSMIISPDNNLETLGAGERASLAFGNTVDVTQGYEISYSLDASANNLLQVIEDPEGTPNTIVTIEGSGNVGIGTDSPRQRLEIADPDNTIAAAVFSVGNEGSAISPTTEFAASATGTGWSNVNNILADDGNVASNTTNTGSTELIEGSSYSFDLPDTVTITGVEVIVEGSGSSTATDTADGDFEVTLTVPGSATRTATISSTSLSTYVLGGPNDLWGTAITVATIENAEFGAELVFDGTTLTSPHEVEVDHISIRVYFDPSGDIPYTIGTESTDNSFIISSGSDLSNPMVSVLNSGLVGIRNSSPAFSLQVGTSSSNGNGAHVTDGGAWTNGSSREWKTNFRDLNPQEILERLMTLSVTRWEYKDNDEGDHIGPTAEDFRKAFGLGHSEQYIATVDADGVALAAIQGLNQKLEEKDKIIKTQQEEIDELHARLEKIESLLLKE